MHRELSPVERFARQQHVVQDGEVRKEPRDLKRAGDPARRPLMRRQRGDVGAKHADGSLAHRRLAADQIEQRGLAGAVRSDHRAPFAGERTVRSTRSTALRPPKIRETCRGRDEAAGVNRADTARRREARVGNLRVLAPWLC